jgi:hypothetical protein
MALYKQELIEHILGITLYTPNWYLGLYVLGQNPVTSLSTAEVPGARVLTSGLLAWNGTAVSNSSPITTGLSTLTCDVGGWFMVNGSSPDILWTGVFAGLVSVTSGASLTFEIGSVVLSIATP